MSIENECISKEEVLNIPASEVIIIDVRSIEEYNEGHIKNVLHIPLANLASKLEIFEKNKLFVTACGKGGGRSIESAKLLMQNGFNAAWLCGGSIGWLNS